MEKKFLQKKFSRDIGQAKSKNLKSRKARSQLSFLYCEGMSSPGSSNFKTKKIFKRNIKKKDSDGSGPNSQNHPQSSLKTPIKSQTRNLDQQKTIKKIFPKFCQENLTKSLDFYHSSNPYVLGQINSISFYNGRFYDLLKLKKESFTLKKQIKCNCSKSRCQAKYCQCYAKGVGCSPLCGCVDCKNLVGGAQKQVEMADKLCKCSKSGCIKKYCECFQRGDACSSKCRCTNCQNTTGEPQKSH